MKAEEFFHVKDNSKVWPSDNPDDHPSITFTCRMCQEKITIPNDALAIPSAIDRHVEGHYLRYKGVIN